MSLYGKDVSLPDDQLAMIDHIGEYAREVLLPLDREWDRHEDTQSVYDVLDQLSEMGFLNLMLPESAGGLGCNYQTYAAILHELAYASPSTAVTVAVHNMVGKVLGLSGKEPHKQTWLEGWGKAENFGAFALSEAGAGSDARAVTTKAVKVDGGYEITGEKMWITNGMHARWFLTMARIDGAEAGNDLLAIVVDGNADGLGRSKIEGKMGIRGSETAVISYDNVFAPDDYVLGEPGTGLRVFLATLNEGRIGIGCQASGIAEACLDEMTSYASQRFQFNQPIGKFQAVSNMIADSAMELEASRALIARAAFMVDQKTPDRSASSMAKLYATESANRTAYRAVQIHGGSGVVNECRVEQLFRDVRVTTIYEGTSEIQNLLIARELDEHVQN